MTNENHIAVPDAHPVGKISCLKSPIMGPVIAALFVSLMSTTVLAAVPESGVPESAMDSQPAGTSVGNITANPVSPATTPAVSAFSDHTHLAAAGDAVEEIGLNSGPLIKMQKKETPGLPYALVLALVALIGLVPVSRSRR